MNLISLVRDVAAQYSALLQINTNASCYQFTTHVLARLKAEGYEGWGYVGKTNGEGQYRPPTGFPRQVGPYTITGVSHDAIGCATLRVDLLGGGNDGPDPLGTPASPQWLEIPPEHWRPNNPIIPFDGPVTPAPVPVVPGREEALDELAWLDAYYAAPEGLQRPNGLSLNGKPDFLGIAAWYLDEYQQARIAGKSRADARAVYVSKIRHSDEWKAKHPGETP